MRVRTRPDEHPRLAPLPARKPAKVAAIAPANKTARIAWAVLVGGEAYRAPADAARL